MNLVPWRTFTQPHHTRYSVPRGFSFLQLGSKLADNPPLTHLVSPFLQNVKMNEQVSKRLDAGLLFLRLSFASMILYGHGWGKLMQFSERADRFPDPLGIGSPASLVMAISAEVGCALLVMLGLGTRLAVIPLIVTMAVVVFVVHGDISQTSSELALVFGFGFTAIGLLGAGDYSLDALIRQRRMTNTKV